MAAFPKAFLDDLYEKFGGLGGPDSKSKLTYEQGKKLIWEKYKKKVSRTKLHRWYKAKGNEEMAKLHIQLTAQAKIDHEANGEELSLDEMMGIVARRLLGLTLSDEDNRYAAATLRELTKYQTARTNELKRSESIEKLKARITELETLLKTGPKKGQSEQGCRKDAIKLLREADGLL